MQQIDPNIGAALRQARDFLTHEHSLFKTLNIEPLLIGRGKVSFGVDLPAEFAGPDGAIHGALLSIILDSIMGITVFTVLEKLTPIATVNLRTDYLHKAEPNTRIVCSTECVHYEDEIARVAGDVKRQTDNQALATGFAAFMVGTRGSSPGSRL